MINFKKIASHALWLDLSCTELDWSFCRVEIIGSSWPLRHSRWYVVRASLFWHVRLFASSFLLWRLWRFNSRYLISLLSHSEFIGLASVLFFQNIRQSSDRHLKWYSADLAHWTTYSATRINGQKNFFFLENFLHQDNIYIVEKHIFL